MPPEPSFHTVPIRDTKCEGITSQRAMYQERMCNVSIAKEMWRCGWKAITAENGNVTFVRGGGRVRSPNGVRLWEWLLYIEKRSRVVAKAKKSNGGKSAFAKDHPALWEYLSLSVHRDGTERHTSSLTIFCDEGVLKCCMSDKDSHEVAFWSADSWEELLVALEEDLSAGQGDWRASKGKARK